MHVPDPLCVADSADTTFNPGAGMVLDDNTLYAGLVGDLTLAAQLTSYASSDGNPTITIADPGTLTYGKVSSSTHRRVAAL